MESLAELQCKALPDKQNEAVSIHEVAQVDAAGILAKMKRAGRDSIIFCWQLMPIAPGSTTGWYDVKRESNGGVCW